MKINIHILLLLGGIVSSNMAAALVDTKPPVYTWVSPKESTVYRTNTIRLCVDAQDNPGGSGIQKVVYYVQYVDISYSGSYKQKEHIATITTYPYEFVGTAHRYPIMAWVI